MREQPERPRRKRRVLGGLQDRRVSAQQCREGFPGDVGDRRVRRDDETRNAERLPDDHRALVRHRTGRRLIEAPALPATKNPISIAASVSPRALRDLLFLAPRGRQSPRDAPASGSRCGEESRPLDDRRGGPGRLRLTRPVDGGAHVGCRGSGHLADLAARRRVDLCEQATLRGQHISAANQIRDDGRDRGEVYPRCTGDVAEAQVVTLLDSLLSSCSRSASVHVRGSRAAFEARPPRRSTWHPRT